LNAIIDSVALRVKSLALVFFLTVFSAVAFSQEPAKPAEPKPDVKIQETKPPDSKPAPKAAYTLRVRSKPILNFSLKAEKAKLSDIAADLSRRLKIPVVVNPVLDKQLVSLDFSELTLEPAMILMAPQVYIDYEVQTGDGEPARPLGIFFYAANQAEPPANAVVPGRSESLLFEGDTEDGVEAKTDEAKKKIEEQPLRIQFQNNILSVKAKQQPLALVLLKIGSELGIPVDIEYDTTEVVDTEINKLSVEDAMRRISPNIRLFVRADLQRSERKALRLVLAEPGKSTRQGL
jgi:hypothetical protein